MIEPRRFEKSPPWLPLPVSEVLNSLEFDSLTAEELGGRLRLWCRAWADPRCALPDQDVILARWSGLGGSWLALREKILDGFHPEGGFPGWLFNDYLTRERESYEGKCSKARAAVEGRWKRQRGGNKVRTDVDTDVDADVIPLLPSFPPTYHPSSPPPEKREGFASKSPTETEKKKLPGVTPNALRADSTLEKLRKGAVQKRWVSDSDADRLRYFAAAEHALATDPANAGDLFSWIVKGGNWKVLTARDEERAQHRLKRAVAVGPAAKNGNGSAAR